MGTIQLTGITLVYAPRVLITLKTADFLSIQEPQTTLSVDRLSMCCRHEDLESVLRSPPPILSGPLSPCKRIW